MPLSPTIPAHRDAPVPVNTELVLEALRHVQNPAQQRDIVSLHMVHDVAIREGTVWLTVRLTPPSYQYKSLIEQGVRSQLSRMPDVREVQLKFEADAAQQGSTGEGRAGLPGVRNMVAVGSGKGGVGKTTVAVNLAIALVEMGFSVGLLDADVYGPNVPLMMGVRDTPRLLERNMIEPLTNYGVKLMSMGFVNPGDKPVIWRGPMLHSAIQQFLKQVDWGVLDYLIIDLPPGTGDVALTLAQSIPLTGAIVVTTPSDVSLEDGRKALNMFAQFRIDLLGVVENMSYFVCPHCQTEADIFSRGGGQRTAEQFGVPFLGALPIEPEIRKGGDTGRPIALEGQDSARAQPIYQVARRVVEQVNQRNATAPAPDFLKVRA